MLRTLKKASMHISPMLNCVLHFLQLVSVFSNSGATVRVGFCTVVDSEGGAVLVLAVADVIWCPSSILFSFSGAFHVLNSNALALGVLAWSRVCWTHV